MLMPINIFSAAMSSLSTQISIRAAHRNFWRLGCGGGKVIDLREHNDKML